VELAPSIHAVPVRGATVFLLAEERLTLVDAGLPGSRQPLLAYLHGIGRSITELERIICTHGHPDHIGGVRELVGPHVEVLMHPADLAALQGTFRDVLAATHGGSRRGHLIQFLTRHPGQATPLTDGQLLPVAGGLEVIHTPGHTPGSICLFARGSRVLFSGDVLTVSRGHLDFASTFFSHDIRAAQASVLRLADYDVEQIAFSHFPAWQTDANAALASLMGSIRK
jgi:glyoxylase-like metal-dependent hydrolase (beta-lactamase superfamily II)